MTSWDPGSLAEGAATALTAAAVVIAAAVWLTTRAWQPTMPVLLELLLAAGLLRLGATDSWRTIAAAAAIVAIRTVIRTGIRTGTHTGVGPAIRRFASATTLGRAPAAEDRASSTSDAAGTRRRRR